MFWRKCEGFGEEIPELSCVIGKQPRALGSVDWFCMVDIPCHTGRVEVLPQKPYDKQHLKYLPSIPLQKNFQASILER